jgi:predicted GNAT family acetyltransferase
MWIKASEKDRDEINAYCMVEPISNLFILADIENFGFDSRFQDVWYELREGKMIGVVLRYHDNLIIYSKNLESDFEIIKEVESMYKIRIISGKRSVIDNYSKQHDLTYFSIAMEYTDTIIDKKTSRLIKVATTSDATDIARCYAEYNAFKGLYSDILEERAKQITDRMVSGEGKHVFIKDEELIISHGNTSGEMSFAGMIGGLFTNPLYQRKGYASEILTYLTNDLISRDKKAVVLFSNRELKPFFDSHGFVAVDDWAILRR